MHIDLFSTPLVKPSEVFGELEERDLTIGIYGWWFDGCLLDVPREGCLTKENKHLLYVGIAPQSLKRSNGGQALRARLRNHVKHSIRQSTLRLSLASLIKDEYAFEFWRDAQGKARMSKVNEYALTSWMEEHSSVSISATVTPWEVEDSLIRSGPALPLNLEKSTHSFKSTLNRLRTSLGR